MAGSARSTTYAVERLRELEQRPYDFGFFAALRRLECLHADKPRIGESARPADEAVRIGQKPSLAFAPSALAEFTVGEPGKRSYLATYFFGVFGPNGPLPLHLTEYAHSRELNFDDPTFRRFVDVFHHRMASLFYRAWADCEPSVSFDRGADRRFDVYLGALVGLGPPELRGMDAVPDHAKLSRAGLFGLKTRPAEGLIEILEDFFSYAFEIRQFVGERLTLPPKSLLRLGEREEEASLGRTTVLGASVWNAQHAFRIICGPLTFAEFRRMLPGKRDLTRLRDLVRSYLGDEFRWTVNLILRKDEVPRLRLGETGRLGWTTWLGTRCESEHADDVLLDPFFRFEQARAGSASGGAP